MTWGLAYGPDGNLYVSDGSNHRILRYDGTTGDFIDVFAQGPELIGPTHILFHGDDVFVAMWNQALFRGGIARIDTQTGAIEATFGTNFGRTNGPGIGPDGNLYANDFDLRRIRVFDPQTGGFLRAFGGPVILGQPMEITFEPDGKLLVTDWNGGLRRVDPVSGTLVQNLVSGLNNSLSHKYAPDGTLIADSHFDRQLRRFDAQTGTSLGTWIDLGFEPDKFIFMPIPEPSGLAWGIVASVVGLLSFRCSRRTTPINTTRSARR